MAANSHFAVALHLLTSLALRQRRGQGLATSAYLASSVNTNPVVVRRLLSRLAKAGLVEALRGKEGGVRLTRPAAKISLLVVYQATGPEPAFGANPAAPNPDCPLSLAMAGILEPLRQELGTALERSLGSHHLSELADQAPA